VYKPLKLDDFLSIKTYKTSLVAVNYSVLPSSLLSGCQQTYISLTKPSAYLDSEQRIIAARVIKRPSHAKKTAFIVEHDFIMATYLADRHCLRCLDQRKSQQARGTADRVSQQF
jgi:ATP-binding cassette subfamily E protein 1